MALADLAAKLTSGLPHQTCATCHALANMSPEDAAILRSLLADRGVRYSDLAAELAADPDSPTIDSATLSRHARGGCSAHEKLRS